MNDNAISKRDAGNNPDPTHEQAVWAVPEPIGEYRLNFFGNKKHMLSQIADLLPQGTETVADLMSGSGIVAWFLKHQGFRIVCSDIMRYPCVRCTSLIENQSTLLSESDVSMLCSGKQTKGLMIPLLQFYQRTFGETNCRFLEAWTRNIPKLEDPMKRHIAVYVVVYCISKHFKYAAVHWSKCGLPTGKKNLLSVDLEQQVRHHALNEFPRFLFDNGKENLVYNMDAVELISRIHPDVAYIDPPYASAGGAYEANYAIFDDLVSLLSGDADSVLDPSDSKAELAPYTKFQTRTSGIIGLARIFERSHHIPCLIVSYNSTSDITPEEIKLVAEINHRRVEVFAYETRLACTKKNRPNRTTEVLMRCCAEDNPIIPKHTKPTAIKKVA